MKILRRHRTTVRSGAVHVFVMFTSVNWYDSFVLDLRCFCHSKKARIPEAEDMNSAYRSPRHHVR